MYLLTSLGAIALILAVQSAVAETTTITKADGGRLSAIVDLPLGEGKVPAVVLAPGQGYHMTLPAMEATARSLTEQGIAVFRFNWTYFTAEPKGQPSTNLLNELKDLQAVVTAARQHPRVAPQRISVGGKSLGSMVAWRAFVSDPHLRSALLLTPVCSRIPKGDTAPKAEAKENYPGFETEQRPTLWISGDKDPLCAPQVLYGFAGSNARTARIAIVGGDHGFENNSLPSPASDVARKRNITAASILSSAFIAETTISPP